MRTRFALDGRRSIRRLARLATFTSFWRLPQLLSGVAVGDPNLARAPVIDDKQGYLPLIQNSFKDLAADFQAGTMSGTYIEPGADIAFDVSWRGANSFWDVTSRDPVKPMRDPPLVTRQIWLVNGSASLTYDIHRAKVTIRPRQSPHVNPLPRYLHILPSQFWHSGRTDGSSLDVIFANSTLERTTTRLSTHRTGNQLKVAHELRVGTKAECEFEIGDKLRCIKLTPPGAVDKMARDKAEFRWETLPTGKTYLAESKVWVAVGLEDFKREPAFHFTCKSISPELPSTLKFEIADLRLPKGVKILRYLAGASAPAVSYVGSESDHLELCLRREGEARRGRGFVQREVQNK